MKTLFVITVVVLALAGFIFGITRYLAVDDLAGCKIPQGAPNCDVADAIVAISGGDTSARVQEAVELYKAGWAPALVFSGAALDPTGPSNAAAMSRQAITSGVPGNDIITEEHSQDTAANAAFIATIAKQQGFKRIILVTSPYHQRRAGIEFRRAVGPGVEVVNHPTSTDRFWSRTTWWLRPDGWWLSMGELGRIIYITIMERAS